MSEAQLRAACEALCGQVYGLVKDKHAELVQEREEADQANSKFAVEEGGFKGEFGSLKDFYDGAESHVSGISLLRSTPSPLYQTRPPLHSIAPIQCLPPLFSTPRP